MAKRLCSIDHDNDNDSDNDSHFALNDIHFDGEMSNAPVQLSAKNDLHLTP
jgi:hypothetical protein